jgi:hypothetical protein
LQPATIVGGALAREGERTLLFVGGLNLEVLSNPTLPTTPARLAEARRRTRDIFAKLIGQHVLLRARQNGGTLVSASVLQIPGAPAPSPQDAVFASIKEIIARRSAELLGLPGVLAVRPAYRFRNGWITNEPCIVALVQRKISDADLPDESRLPERLDSVPVDVALAGPVCWRAARPPVSRLKPSLIVSAMPCLAFSRPRHEAFSAELNRTRDGARHHLLTEGEQLGRDDSAARVHGSPMIVIAMKIAAMTLRAKIPGANHDVR